MKAPGPVGADDERGGGAQGGRSQARSRLRAPGGPVGAMKTRGPTLEVGRVN